MTSFTPVRIGAKASDATDFSPEVTEWKPLLASRVMMVTEARTRRSSVVRGRRDRRDVATYALPPGTISGPTT